MLIGNRQSSFIAFSKEEKEKEKKPTSSTLHSQLQHTVAITLNGAS